MIGTRDDGDFRLLLATSCLCALPKVISIIPRRADFALFSICLAEPFWQVCFQQPVYPTKGLEQLLCCGSTLCLFSQQLFAIRACNGGGRIVLSIGVMPTRRQGLLCRMIVTSMICTTSKQDERMRKTSSFVSQGFLSSKKHGWPSNRREVC